MLRAVSKDTAVVPVGAIVPLSGAVVPSGWAAYAAADGRFIVGAGDTYSVLETGGSSTHSGITDTVDSDGGHQGSTQFGVVDNSNSGGDYLHYYTNRGTDQGAHTHTYDTGSITPNLYRRENILIQKTGSTATDFPEDAMVFGTAGISTPNLARVTTEAGRLLQAAVATANAGVSSKTVSFTTDTENDSHIHTNDNYYANLTTGDPVFPTDSYAPANSGGVHDHDYNNLTLNRKVKRMRLALYGGSGDYAVVAGLIVLWAGAVDSLPAGWHLCNGSNDTPDLTDRFIEIADTGNEGTTTGNNTLTFSGNSTSKSHGGHEGVHTVVETELVQLDHSDTVWHSHNVDGSDAWIPSYFALAAIMYNP